MIEQQVRDIVSEVQAAAQAGTLTAPMLSVAMAAMQDFIQYLEQLETAPIEVTGTGTAGADAAAEFITGVWDYGNQPD